MLVNQKLLITILVLGVPLVYSIKIINFGPEWNVILREDKVIYVYTLGGNSV